ADLLLHVVLCPVWHFLSFLEAAFRAMSVLNVQAVRSIIYRLVCEQPGKTEDFPGLPKPNPICYSRVAWTLQVESRQEHGLGEFSGECFQAWDLSSPEYKMTELLLGWGTRSCKCYWGCYCRTIRTQSEYAQRHVFSHISFPSRKRSTHMK
uniref:Uncharacterized protein n=1 Tax=Cairina moschata TaxID=8855 RepID=A0A8C3B3Y1_CAIMO